MIESGVRFVILGVIVAIVIGIIGVVSFSWSLDTSPYLQGLTSFLHVVFYIIPIGKLSPILFAFAGLMTLRIVVSVVKTLWQLIPIGA